MTETYNLEGLTTDATDAAVIMIDNYFKNGSVINGANDCEYANGIRDTVQNEDLLKAQGFVKAADWEYLTSDNKPADDEDVCLWVLFVSGIPDPQIPYIGTYSEAQKHNISEGYKMHNHFLRLPTKK